MYSKDELKKLKTEFWTSFGNFSQLKRSRMGFPKKWLLYKTGIKGLELKFDFENKKSIVAITIDSSYFKAEDYIHKIKLLKDEIIPLSNNELFFELNSAKNNYRIFFEEENLSYKKQAHWPEIFSFFFDHMMILEQFIIENKEILEA